MIRWRYLLPRLGILVVAALLINLLIKPITRWAIVHSTQSLTGARVDVGSLDVSLQTGRLTLEQLQLASPRNPMQNLFQAETAELQLDIGKLLNRQGVIDHALLEHVQLGTPRTTSGALPGQRPPPPAQDPALIEVVHGKLQDSAANWLKQLESSVPLVIQDNLETVRLGREMQARWPAEFEKQRQRADALRQQGARLARQIENRSDNPLRDLERFRSALGEARQLASRIAAAQQDLHRLNQQYQTDKQALLAARDRDQRRITSIAGSLSLDHHSLTAMLLGDSQARQVEELISWITWFRSALPNPKTDFQPVRGRGFDVRFEQVPAWIVHNLELDGAGTVAGQECRFAGQVQNLSTEPHLLDEPVIFELRSQGQAHVHVMATIDRRTPNQIDRIRINCPNLSLPEQQWGQPGTLALQVAPGKLNLQIEATIRNDELTGEIRIEQSGLNLTMTDLAQSAGGQAVLESLNRHLVDVDQVEIRIQLDGTLQQPTMELQSDLGPRMAGILESAFLASAEDLALRRKRELKSIAHDHLAGLEQMFLSNSNEILGLLANEFTEIARLNEMLDRPGLSPSFR